MIWDWLWEMAMLALRYMIGFIPEVPIKMLQFEAIADIILMTNRVIDYKMVMGNVAIIFIIIQAILLKNVIMWILRQTRVVTD